MKNLNLEKKTIDFERKMHYKKNQKNKQTEKQTNPKRSINYGYVKKDNIEKYGLKQCLNRCVDYCELSA